MHNNITKRIEDISIQKNATIFGALRLMDQTAARLLLVMEQGKFLGLLSIGDIQRAIVRQTPLDSCIDQILRRNIKVARDSEPLKEVRRRMLELRTEFMPVLNNQGDLVTVHFWEDIFTAGDNPRDRMVAPVVIMAGGEGKRLRPLTNVIPKPLIPVGEKPIIEDITDRFHACGVEDFYISLNYKADLVERYFQDNPKPYRLHYFREDQPLGTAGSLRLLKEKLTTTFFVSNCDILVNHDYAEMFRYHQENRCEITAVAALKVQSVPYGLFECDERGLLLNVREKPNIPLLINVGLYILEPGLLDEIPGDAVFHLTQLMQQVKNRNGRVGIFPIHEGDWTDIGEWKEYFSAINRATG